MRKNTPIDRNVHPYIQELEKEYGVSKTDLNKTIDIKNHTLAMGLYNGTPSSSNFRSKYKWSIKDRLKQAWKMFKTYYKYLDRYNPFDFKSYKEKYNPYGFKIYAEIYKISTPWTRLREFLGGIGNIFKYITKAYFHTPSDIKYYQKNKKRITWFEENIWGWFLGSDKEKEIHKQKLQDHEYNVSKDGNFVEYKTINE